jgi:hypothetical protein
VIVTAKWDLTVQRRIRASRSVGKPKASRAKTIALSKAPHSTHDVAATFAPASSLACSAYVVRAAKTKYGPRPGWGKIEYAQIAITALYPVALPKSTNHSALERRVNEVLLEDPDYKASGRGKVSRQTVLRALQILRAANS